MQTDETGQLAAIAGDAPSFDDAVANDENHGLGAKSIGTILVCGRPRILRKWDMRWLKRPGVELRVIDRADALDVDLETDRPVLVLADAGFIGDDKQPLYRQFLNADPPVPVMVFARSAREADIALDDDAHDVVRKPFDWRLIGHRVQRQTELLNSRSELGSAKQSLQSAFELVNQLRQSKIDSDSFEPATGLPNRGKLHELLLRSAPNVRSSNNLLAVMVIGLNRFNLITESFGVTQSNVVATSVGSMLRDTLQTLADRFRLERGLRTASVARIAPDRFAIMTSASDDPEELAFLRRRLLQRLGEAVEIDGQTLYLSPSIGAAVYPSDVNDATQLLAKAEAAMRDGRDRGVQFSLHSPRADARLARTIDIESRLHTALANEELTLAYQPLVDVQSDRIVGCEALLRWPQPDGSFFPPGEFVPIAEGSGLMVRIGEFVLDTACAQLAEWRKNGHGPIRMSVNVSKCQLMHDQFPDVVRACLEKHEVQPAHLDLELSERGALTVEDGILERLRELKDLGVSLSIDDFGTGEAAISYLKDLPVDVLKIDRSYVLALCSDGAETTITSAMVALGQRLNLTIVAEGVESDDQLAIVRSMGCDQFQGFLRSPAVDPDAFVGLLTA